MHTRTSSHPVSVLHSRSTSREAFEKLHHSFRNLFAANPADSTLSILAPRVARLADSTHPPVRAAVVRFGADTQVSSLLFKNDVLFDLCERAARCNGGTVLVKLTSEGFVINAGDLRRSFDSVESFISALAELVSTPQTEKIELSITAPEGLAGMEFLIFESLAALETSPAITEILSHADFLVLSAPARAALLPPDSARLQHFLTFIPGSQFIVSEPEEGLAAHWVHSLRATLPLPIFQTGSGSTPRTLLAGDTPEARRLVQDYRKLRDMRDVLEQFRSTSQQALDDLQKKRSSVDASSPSPTFATDAANELRRLGENCLQTLNDDVALLVRNREDATRDLVLPRGTFFDLIRRIPETLDREAVTCTDDGKVTRLKAREESVSEVQQRILRRLFADFDEEALLVSDTFAACLEDINARLAQVEEGITPLTFRRFDPSRLHDFAGNVVTAPVSFKGEIPRITAGAFLWQTVQHPVMIIFTIMMPAQMFSAQADVARHIRDWRFDVALYGLLPLYIITPFYLNKKLTKERDAALDRELERFRQTVQGELDRSVRMSLEEKKRLVGEYVRTTLDDLRRQTADRIQQITSVRDRKKLADQAERAASLQRVDARIKELTSRIQLCDQIKSESETIRRGLEASWNPLI